MNLVFLGTAGYHPSESRHTSGILINEAAPDTSFLLDAGTGTFRLIGRELPRRLHVFLSHAHLDHMVGATFLLDVMLGRKLEIHLHANAATLDALRSVFNSPLFPIAHSFQEHEFSPGVPFEVAGVHVNTHALTHPGGALGYRFEWQNHSLCYITDTRGDALYHDFIRGCNTLVHERNFPDRLQKIADDSGHCTSHAFVAAAKFSGAQRVIATHFNPLTLSDPLLEDDIYGQLPGVIGAFDGLEIEL